MKIDVVIPTYMREEKLKQVLSSIHSAIEKCGENIKVQVRVFYSNEKDWLTATHEMNWPWVEHYLLPSGDFRLPDFWNDRLQESVADAFCYLTDDVLLNQYCLSIASMEIEKMGFDGVVGFRIENHTEPYQPCLASFGIIGLKYADRFKNRRVFCPDYMSLYADIELHKQAETLGRFKFHKACSLVHFHPSYIPEANDFTHLHTRRDFSRDWEVFQKRLTRGLVWGISDMLINQ